MQAKTTSTISSATHLPISGPISALISGHVTPHEPLIINLLPERLQSMMGRAVLILAGSLFIAACAQVALPVGFSPVPITLQTLAVMMVGLGFGSRLGVATVLAYLAEGALGLPVFAQGQAGILTLVGPTGGYLFGFIAAAWISGRCADLGWDRNWRCALCMVVATAAIFACGLLWLAMIIPFESLLLAGFWPYLPGAVVKGLIAAGAFPAVRAVADRMI